MSRIHLTVPASAANLGPGFDRLGIALSMRMELIADSAQGWSVATEGQGRGCLSTDRTNLVAQAYLRTCGFHRWPPRPFSLRVINPIPLSKGLGSSAAAIVAGVMLAHLAHGGALDTRAVCTDAVKIEGHADNVLPAALGGVCCCEPGPRWERKPISSRIRVLVAIPPGTALTKEMREILPSRRSCLVKERHRRLLARLLRGLTDGRPEELKVSQMDGLHQPYRLRVLPVSRRIFGALVHQRDVVGPFLCGSGPTVGAWVLDPLVDARSIEKELQAVHPEIRAEILHPDLRGAVVERVYSETVCF